MKKKLLSLLLMTGPFVAGVACGEAAAIPVTNEIKATEDLSSGREEVPVYKVEKKAQFPGGTKKLIEYLRNNLKYPEAAVDVGIEGTVLVSFVVKKDGSIDDVKAVRSVDPLLDEEAIRVVKSMPKWVPAQLNGKDVSSQFRLPIAFKLNIPANPANEEANKDQAK